MGLLCPEGIEMMERWTDFGRIERNLSEFREIWDKFQKIEQIAIKFKMGPEPPQNLYLPTSNFLTWVLELVVYI